MRRIRTGWSRMGLEYTSNINGGNPNGNVVGRFKGLETFIPTTKQGINK
jgi:hypothetical protein